MATSERFDSVVVGVVDAVNERGIKLDGRVEERLSLRRRRRAPGARRDGRLHARQGGLPARGRPGRRRYPHGSAASRRRATLTGAPSVKDRTITRLAILKAAAEFGAARPNLKSGDVLAIAASWERWITREQERRSTSTRPTTTPRSDC
jgi:hypothetical protein